MTTTWEQAALTASDRLRSVWTDIDSFEQLNTALDTAKRAVHYVMIGRYALGEMAPGAMDKVLSTVIAKQKDYGHGNILRHGITGVNVRMCDKVERIKHLSAKALRTSGGALGLEAVHNEPLADSWLDLVGYSIIAVMLLDGTFELPLRDDAERIPSEACYADEDNTDRDGYAVCAPSGADFQPWDGLPFDAHTIITTGGSVYSQIAGVWRLLV